MAKNMLRMAEKLRAMKFKLDGLEFKFRALEFFTTTHLVKTKYRAISIILYLLTITPP